MIKKFARGIKQQLRFLINQIKKRQLKIHLLQKNKLEISRYTFTIKDIELFVTERFISLPKMGVGAVDDSPHIIMATINNIPIFWPKDMQIQDLPWLYHEVFDSFDTNPSSYDNPILDLPPKFHLQ